jgi:hypothetical protein
LLEESRKNTLTTLLTIHVPSSSGRAVNTLVALREGHILTRYAKLHLYDAFNMQESARVDAGHEIAPLIDVDGMKVGLMTCYDLRFPELALSLALQGPIFWHFLQHGFGARSKSSTGRRYWRRERWTRPVISWRQVNVAIRILARVR